MPRAAAAGISIASSPVPTRLMMRQRSMPAIISAETGWIVTMTASAWRMAAWAAGVVVVCV